MRYYWESPMIKRILIYILPLLPFFAHAQEIPGLGLGNYSGVNSLYINPSALLHSKLYRDVNIIGADVFFQNNVVYWPSSDLSGLKLLTGSVPNFKYGVDEKPFLINSDQDFEQFYNSVRVLGPAFMMVEEKYAIAIHLGARSMTSVDDLPKSVMNFAYYGLDYKPQHGILYNEGSFSMASMSWAEFGVTYNREIEKRAWDWRSLGITFKLLFGYEGLKVDVQDLSYVVVNDCTLDIRQLDAEIAFSAPISYSTNEMLDNQLQVGSGFSFDLGYTWLKAKKTMQWHKVDRPCEMRFVPYDFRLGLSLLDVGILSFKTNAEVHSYDNIQYYWNRIDSLGYDNLQYALNDISQRFYGNPEASLKSESFSMMLPAAFSAQLDYHLRDEWFLNGYAVLALPVSPVKRPNLLYVSPRYETEKFEAGMPVSFYNFTQPRIGLYGRLYGFTVGTDKLGTFLGLSDFYGMDFYFSIRLGIPFWIKGRCPAEKLEYPCERLHFQ